MLFNSLLAYAAFPFVGKCSNLIDDAKLRCFWVSFQTFSLFFHQKLWTRSLIVDISEKSLQILSNNP